MIIEKMRRSASLSVGALLVTSGTLAGAIRSGADVPLTAALRDARSTIGDRSPGARSAGALFNIKGHYAPTSAEEHPEPVVAPGPTPAFALQTPGLIGGLPAFAVDNVDQAPSNFGNGGGGYFGGGGGGFYGGGGGGTGGRGNGGGGNGGGDGGGGGSGGFGGCGTGGTEGDGDTNGGSGGSGNCGGGTGSGGGGTGGGGTGGGGGDLPPIVTPVPEPQTWAMMVLGFGAIGAALRKRQRVTVSYA